MAFQRRVRVLARLLSRELHQGRSVLDLGCGDGSVARAIMTERPEYEFRGIDVVKRPHTWIPVDLFDGQTIPFPDHSFDWVTMVDVLHHTNDPKVLLAEARRVARLGIVIKDHSREGFAAYSTLRFMDWVGNRGHGVALPYNYLSKDGWNRVLAETGLVAATWTENLHLYPIPFTFIFDRQLHFIATLVAD
jgi:ubiquinone/menaquinone biosynthesis C-methylase UbiE